MNVDEGDLFWCSDDGWGTWCGGERVMRGVRGCQLKGIN